MRCTKRGRIKLVDRECHIFEETARVVILADHALFVGNAVFSYIHKILCGTLDTDDREKSECYIQMALVAIAKISADTSANIFRDTLASADAARREVTAGRFNHLGAQYHGLGDLNGCNRHIGRKRRGIVFVTTKFTCDAAAVNTDASFTAVENNFLLYNSDAVKFLGAAHMYAALKGKFYIKADGYLIKTAVKLHGIYRDAGPEYVCALGSDIIGAVNDLLTKLGKIYPNILEAIFITARVKDSVSINTNGLFTARKVW